MNLIKKQSFIAVSILVAYMTIAVFGLLQFGHTEGMAMAGCPYAQGSFSVCEDSFEHIDHWHQFSNVTFSSFFTFSLLIFGLFLSFFITHKIFTRYFYRYKFYIKRKLFTFKEVLTEWLSLFENSPPVSITYNNYQS